MKCSECGGNVITSQHAVYRTDGGSSGTHYCQDCGKTKHWSIPGTPGTGTEPVIDMSEGE